MIPSVQLLDAHIVKIETKVKFHLEKLNGLGFKEGEYNRIIVTMHSEKTSKKT